MVSIARKNLFQDLPRFVVAQAGIMFAVSLVTIQTGIFNGFTRSTSVLIDNSDADIWVASEDVRHLELTLPIPLQRLNQARQVTGVDRAEALIVQSRLWRNASSQLNPVRVIGFDPNGQLFKPWHITQGSINQLKQPYTVMLDKSDLAGLNVKGIGDVAEVGSFRARVVGITKGIRSIVSNAFMFTSLENARAYNNSPITTPADNPPAPPKLTSTDGISYVLVRAQPGQDLQALKRELEAALPDTRAYTRAEMADLTQTYWQKATSVGFILGLGAVVGMIVGIVIVGQILYSSVTDHLKEFGTLKAMGSSDWFIYGVIIEQALWMAVLGYLPGMALCFGLGAWTLETQGITILIGSTTAAGVFGVTILMCIGAAVFAIQKVTRLDPAIVFRA
ncbi:MAG TPA: ABC transporter permease [Candidatus Caenarcaniphilales bacterium]